MFAFSIPLGGLAVHTQKMKEKPDEIVKTIKAVLKATDYIRTRKPDILSFIEAKWGIKEADIRESIYRDMVGLFSRDGVASDDTLAGEPAWHPRRVRDAGLRNSDRRMGLVPEERLTSLR